MRGQPRKWAIGAVVMLLTFAACKRESDTPGHETVETGMPTAAGVLRAGDPAPPLGLEKLLQAPEGATAAWENLRGKAVVLEFWATWCGPCIAAIPHMNELAEKYADKPVQFIAVTSEKEEVITKFLERKPIKGWVGLDTDRSMHHDYMVKGIPRTVLVDAQGRLAGFTHPVGLKEEVLDDLLAGRPLKGVSLVHGGDDADGLKPGLEPVAGGDLPAPLFQLVIRPVNRDEGTSVIWMPDKMTMAGVTVPSIVDFAYDVPAYQVDIACELPESKYDVTVLLPPGHAALQRPLLRQALEMTFGLQGRRETRTVGAYLLVVGEAGARLTPTAMEATHGSGVTAGHGSLTLTNKPIEELARLLATRLNRHVFDETGLTGRYDVTLFWDPEEPDDLLEAVRTQLGLDLKPAERPIEILVVERAESEQ